MTQSRSEHVEAGAMVRWIDGEASDLERRAVDAHVAECTDCDRELAGLQAAARTVNAVLTGFLDVAAPAAAGDTRPALVATTRMAQGGGRPNVRHAPRPGWRIAASVALIIGALAAVPELRALVLEAWRAVTEREREIPAVHSAPAAREPEMRPIVEVTPADAFTVEFEAVQTVGQVIVSVHDSATAIVLSSDPQAAVMVLPSRVRIANRGSRADYQVIVPPTLDTVVVTIAGRRRPVTAGAGVIIPLQ